MTTSRDQDQPESSTAGPIAQLVHQLNNGQDDGLLRRMKSGWAILNPNQPNDIAGACMLLPDPVVASVNDLDDEQRQQFMSDFLTLGDAVLQTTQAERINYLILCNQAPQLHAHVIPRFTHEDTHKRKMGPFEAYDFANAPLAKAHPNYNNLRNHLQQALAHACPD